MLLMSNRVMLYKLLLLHHVATLRIGTLARDVYEKVKHLKARTLFSECSAWLDESGLGDPECYSKLHWKSKVKEIVFKRNKDNLVQMSKKYKKVGPDSIPPGPLKMKSYFNELSISDSRLRFKIAAKMTPRVACNFKNDPRFKLAGWLCVGCPQARTSPLPATADLSAHSPPSPPQLDTQQHITTCPGYADLREGLDLQTDRDLVKYFRQVIERRIADEELN